MPLNCTLLKIKILIFGCAGSSLLRRLSLAAARPLSGCGAWTPRWGAFSCCGAWALECGGSVVVAHGLRCSSACGIFLDQGWNPCPLHCILNHWTTREVSVRFKIANFILCEFYFLKRMRREIKPEFDHFTENINQGNREDSRGPC